MEQGLTQRQATGDLVEIPGFPVRFAVEAPWRPIQSLKARLEGRDPCEPSAEARTKSPHAPG
jgi:hypothetical protein